MELAGEVGGRVQLHYAFGLEYEGGTGTFLHRSPPPPTAGWAPRQGEEAMASVVVTALALSCPLCEQSSLAPV